MFLISKQEQLELGGRFIFAYNELNDISGISFDENSTRGQFASLRRFIVEGKRLDKEIQKRIKIAERIIKENDKKKRNKI